MSEFEPGDVVVLKSGGPRMTVAKTTSREHIICTWFDEKKILQNSDFVSKTLKKYEKPDAKVQNPINYEPWGG